ncbi:MAG: AMP-binding protein [Geodermatophilaceae bacterium]
MRPLHALLLPPGRQLLDALAAALDGGPAILPLDPQMPHAVRDRLLAHLRPHALVDGSGVHALDDPADLTPDIAVVVATSGSTGMPKGVQLTAAALRHSVIASLDRLSADPGQRWLCCLPTHHIAGLQVLVRSLVAGSTPDIRPAFEPAALRDTDAAFVSLVPTMLHRALAAGVDLTGFRAILLGAAAADPALLLRARKAGVRVVVTYGMSETCGGAVYDGVPLAGVDVAVDAADGRIRLAGPVLAAGYRLAPELTAAAFVDGWHVTQDAGRLDAHGRLHALGRLDDIVVTGGVNVSLLEVARAVARHPAVTEAAAFARPDPEWGQRIVAVVVAAAGAPPLAALRELVAACVGVEAAPRELIAVDALPVLAGGKLDRATLHRLGSREPAGT